MSRASDATGGSTASLTARAASPYAGRAIAFATMHEKERLVRDAFSEHLGARIVAPAHLDTDVFGTFAGDIPRTLAPEAAARAKARLGMQSAGVDLGLASEGSFASAGFGPVIENTELLLFIDAERDMELVEGMAELSSIPAGRRVTTVSEVIDFAKRIGFPQQGLIVQSSKGGSLLALKELRSLGEVEAAVESLFRDDEAIVSVLPDYRAHRSPSRATVIRRLGERMAKRLATPCAECGTPGFGHVGVERGLPCRDCGAPTHRVRADRLGCAKCDATELVPRDETTADPRWCDRCNP